jgi:hypothetical protein
VSVFLVDLVLKARLPLDMQSRAAKKLVLVCLAKVCQNDNGFECYPSRSTLALAAERTERTIDAFLDDLAGRGFIRQTDKARRHRPRTWNLNVPLLVDLQPAASLDPNQDLQQVATLTGSVTSPEPVLDRQSQTVDLQSQNLDLQLSGLDLQHVATERSERSSEQSEQVQGADAPGFRLSKEDHEENYAAVKRLAVDAVEALGVDARHADLVAKARAMDAAGIVRDDRTLDAAVFLAVGFARLQAPPMRATA